jgi:hypothetical protein
MAPDFGTTVIEPLRVLDFDTECRPMHYSEWRPESQITAYAWSWVGEHHVGSEVLAPDDGNDGEWYMLSVFLHEYEKADIVTGHYIRKHDLPLLNDHCLRLRGEPLPSKLVHDTKTEFKSVRALGLSQENLAHQFKVAETKHSMSGALWRQANSLTAEGRAETIKRVEGDVRQHKALRQALLEADALHPPKVWSP